MPKRAAAPVLLAILLAAAAVQGCSARHPAATDDQFTVVYAELMLLSEQDKAKAVPDSAYRVHAAEVLKKNGTSVDEFRKRSELLMDDDRAWRDFLGRVSLAFDSIKTARALPPKRMPADNKIN